MTKINPDHFGRGFFIAGFGKSARLRSFTGVSYASRWIQN